MKNIFIVTDFSDASIDAGYYGVELARHFKANVFLFHAYQAPVPIPESYFVISPEQLSEEAIKRLKVEAETINKYHLVNIQTCAAEGATADIILSEAKRVGAELIICGMKGGGKIFRKIFGSTTTTLIRKSTIPVIVAPEELRFRLPGNIVFASDGETLPTHQHVQILEEMGELFDSKLSIVSVVNGKWDNHFAFREYYLDFIKELRLMHPTIECLQGTDIPDSLENYIKSNDTDMIAMIPHTHSLLERVFASSITEQMAFLTHVPLLILPDLSGEQANGIEMAEHAHRITDS
ncbi:MAG: universal stress protein [Ferruginibacter sp.]